ncbi:hypothetical protein SCHPADRAFT_628908 [Schizopora paradoxa]|uniref:Uncharacterized protein n=1 Tax=Schizopora paradoxa TaxID=27342 RepID=A0A0H2RSQ9_9AGAM|nr:hypothetical protein SCHPADRAFT_628908 [Schizopora paradoxa]
MCCVMQELHVISRIHSLSSTDHDGESQDLSRRRRSSVVRLAAVHLLPERKNSRRGGEEDWHVIPLVENRTRLRDGGMVLGASCAVIVSFSHLDAFYAISSLGPPSFL